MREINKQEISRIITQIITLDVSKFSFLFVCLSVFEERGVLFFESDLREFRVCNVITGVRRRHHQKHIMPT